MSDAKDNIEIRKSRCECGWRRPMIALTTVDGKQPPTNVVPAYPCPQCGRFHIAAEVSDEVAGRIAVDLSKELTAMLRAGASSTTLAGKSFAEVNAGFAQFAREVSERLDVAAKSGQAIETTDGIDGAAYAAAMTVSMMRQARGHGKDIEAEIREARAIFAALAKSFAIAAKRDVGASS